MKESSLPSTKATGRGSFYFFALLLGLGALLPTASQAGAIPLFNGMLRLETGQALTIEVLRDDYKFAQNPMYKVAYLPPFEFQYVQSEDTLIPVQRGSIPSDHPSWEYMLEPGRICRTTVRQDCAMPVSPSRCANTMPTACTTAC